MFLVIRSAFWLTVAFMVIRPGADLPDAQALASQTLAAGSQVVSKQIDSIECADLGCVGGKTVIAAALRTSIPPVGLPMHAMPTKDSAPIPRPRPNWAG